MSDNEMDKDCEPMVRVIRENGEKQRYELVPTGDQLARFHADQGAFEPIAKAMFGFDPAPGKDWTSASIFATEWMRLTNERPLPCPFCGRDPIVDLDEKVDSNHRVWCHIHCKRCRNVGDSRIYGEAKTGYRDYSGVWVDQRTLCNAKREAVDEAMRRWNTRTQPKVKLTEGTVIMAGKLNVELSQSNGVVHKLKVDPKELEGASVVAYGGVKFGYHAMRGSVDGKDEMTIRFVELGKPVELDGRVEVQS